MLVTGPASPSLTQSSVVSMVTNNFNSTKLRVSIICMVTEELDRSTTGLDVCVYVKVGGCDYNVCRGGCVSVCGRDWQECQPVCACGCVCVLLTTSHCK